MSLRRTLILLVCLALLLPAIPQFSLPNAHASYTFNSSTPTAIELTPGASSYPSAIQASDGTIWVAWQQYFETAEFMTYSTSRGWSVIQSLPTAMPFVISPTLQQFRNGSIILFWSSNQTGRWNLYYKDYSNGAWGPTARLTVGSTFDDFFPQAAISTNSTVYVFWERYFSGTSVAIYYKTYKNGMWSGDTLLSASTNNVDVTPSAMVSYDGKIWVSWSRLASSNYNVMYRTYNGVSWGPETTLTTNNYDLQSNLMQDRNGTIWIFFSRQIQLGSGGNAVFEQKLFYKNTADGSTWTADTQLTSYGDQTTPLDDYEPSVIQGFDKALWIFFSSDWPAASEYDIYYIKSNAISPIHNVVVSQIQAGPSAFQKGAATVLATVSNLGDFSETISLTITATNVTSYTVASAVAENVPAGATVTFMFAWNTTAIPLGSYTVTVSFPRLTGQTVLASGGDTLQLKSLTVLPPTKPGVCRNFRDCPI